VRIAKRRITVALAIAVLLAGFPLASTVPFPGTGNRSGIASAQRDVFVNLTTRGLRFVPDTFQVDPGDVVHVRITQGEAVVHTFTQGKEKDRVLPTSWSNEELHDYFRNNNLTDVEIPPTVGAVVWANFTAPAQVGRYEYVCLIAGHFQAGMYGFMQVGTPPPAEGLSPLAVAGIAGAAIVLAVAALALALRARKRKAGPKPPEPPLTG